MARPTILALDFDGVLCNGLVEYFQSSWQVYRQIWSGSDSPEPATLAESFYRLRPVIEHGFEMPLLIRALIGGTPEAQIRENWGQIWPQMAAEAGLESQQLARALDTQRDRAIARDLEGWLGLQQLYAGVEERLATILAASTPKVYIITTKEGRFAHQLLQQRGIPFPQEAIFGKEVKRPKHETLRQILAATPGEQELWFVEDRLKTLQSVQQQPDLRSVRLFLATWGYNTEKDRDLAIAEGNIALLSLAQFSDRFETWLS